MADPFVAEIRIFGFNFAPTGWATCSGQILPLSQNTALFSLLGTMYGGDGKSTFALPNLMGNAPMHPSDTYFLGEETGSQTVTLLQTEIPAHNHQLKVMNDTGLSDTPVGCMPARGSFYSDIVAPALPMAPQSFANSGGSLPHNNLMPYLVVNFCIALQGIFPPRQ